MKKIIFSSIVLLCTLVQADFKLPEQGAVIGSYVDSGPMADRVTVEEIKKYENLIGKKLVWTYFSDNWIDGVIEFPWVNVQASDKAGTIPYIRLSPWSEALGYQTDPIFKLQKILDGEFDNELGAWAQEAKRFGKTLIIEFGPEVNGNWFPWNGQWNGGGISSLYGDPNYPDGPERYRDAFRKVIDTFRENGADNIVWVFHVDTAWAPWSWWNQPKYYYPGNDYIDWIALSVFGSQLPTHDWLDFSKKLGNFWPQVEEVSLTKPVVIAEFAVIEDSTNKNRKAQWLTDALKTLRTNQKYRRVKGISYWNSPGLLPEAQADMRITSSPQAKNAFLKEISNSYWKGREELVSQEGKND